LHLDPESILFALRHRFRRQPLLLRLLHAFSYIQGFGSVSSFLPCYFAVAVA
jgi:hypothetical protein